MKYLVTLLITILCLQIGQAQTKNYIIYKEYDPDYWVVLTTGQQFDIDINDDGNPDVRYEVFEGPKSRSGSWVITFNGWSACNYCITPIAGYDNYYFDITIPINDSSLVFGYYCLAEVYTYGHPLIYKVALKYNDGDNYYFGWAEFEEIREASYDRGRLHVARTCYCAIPNYPLVWGQTSLTEDVEENKTTDFATLHPNPTTGQVTIMGQDLKAAVVFNTLGQQVAVASGEGETLHIDIANLPAGVYFVNVTDGEGRKCVKKVVRE